MAGFTINLRAQTNKIFSSTSAAAGLLLAITISEASPLSFGSNSLANTAGGTVVLPSNSVTRNYTGGVTTSMANPAPTVAAYNVTGTGLETYVLVLPPSTTVAHTSISSGVNTMDITSITARFNGASADTITSTIAENGTDSFTLGGTLNVQENQIGGQYSGTFQVSIDYN